MSHVNTNNTRQTPENGKSYTFSPRRKHHSLQLDKLLLLENEQKRNTLLPPLEKDPTSYISQVNGNTRRALGEGLTGMNYSRDSMDIDVKIISHLRRHLGKRTHKRLDRTGKMTMVPKKKDTSRWGYPSGKELRTQEPGVSTIFTSYSETGEKVQDGDIRKSVEENNPRLSKPGSTFTSSGTIEVNMPSLSTPLPPITHKSTPSDAVGNDNSSHELQPVFSAPDENVKKTLITEVLNIVSRSSNAGLPVLVTRRGTHQNIGGIQDTMTASLTTPAINGSEVGEGNQLPLSVTINHILDGNLHTQCPADKTVLYLYIASGSTDMEAELSFMQKHLYPQLRSHFKQQGQELRILDLHWGFKDTASVPEILRRAINKAQHAQLGINFVILVGQKYGPGILPSYIPKDEYESILDAASKYRKTQKAVLRAARREIQVLEREVEKEAGDITASAENDKERSNRNVIDDPHVTTAHAKADTENETKCKTDTTTVKEDNNDSKTETTAVKDDNNDSKTNTTTVKDDNNDSKTKTTAVKEDVKENKSEATTDKEHNQDHVASAIKDHPALKALKEAEDQLPDVKSFRQWYLLDDNSVPPVYKLQNISTVYKDITRNDAAKRQVAKLSFASIEARLMKIVRTFAPDVVYTQDALRTDTSSMLDKELHQVLDNPMAADHTACIVRTIDQLMESLDEPAVGDYCDLVSENEQAVEASSWTNIENIRHGLLNGKVSEKNVTSFLVEWANGGIRPGSNRAQYLYMERMCKTLFDQIVGHPDVTVLEKVPTSRTWELFSEVSEHVRQCHERARGLQGREDILSLIESNLKSDTRRPLVVFGKGGCGKSSILGKSATEINQWFKGENVSPRVLVRIIGCTERSTNVRTMLRDVSLQLCHIFGNKPTDVPTDYKGIINDLGCRLEQATEESPIIIIMDGVDRLSDDYEGRRLLWLPLEMPSNVHMIISTISDDKMQCLPATRNLLRGNDSCFLEIGQLELKDGMNIFGSLNAKRRRLTEKQLEIFVEAFRTCPSPLFVKLALAEAVRWTSYMAPNMTRLGETVTKVVTLRFGKLEMDHGEPLTRRALGYISAARHGLTSNEMEDVLSLDDAVMDDIMASYKLPLPRLPTLLWVRLHESLEDFIQECWADNMRTLIWANSQISEVAEERYLSQRDKAPSYHKALAEYFSGTSSGKSKLHSNNDKGENRLVSSQDLYKEPPHAHEDGSDRVYNLRALNELPYHFMKCQMTTQLKQSCLCNYEWMLARLCATSLESLLEEYQAILLLEPADPEWRVLLDVFLLSRDALQRDPRQLASQLVGRLHKIVEADHPKAPGDPKKYPFLHTLLAAAKQSSVPVLIPSVECLTPPGGLLSDLLSGHTEPITAVTLTSDGTQALTASGDRTMKLWDMRTGKVVKSINGMGSTVSDIKTAKRNALAITVEGSLIKIWDINANRCVFTISQYVDPANTSVADEDRILVAVYDGSHTFRSWNIDTFSLLCETHIPDKSVHKDNSILIAAASSGQNVLLAFRSSNSATVQNVRSGKMMKKILCHEKNSSIVALAVSTEYFIICCRQHHVTLHDIHALELFDAVKGVYIRTVLGCAQDNIRHISINLSGSHAIAISPNSRNNTSDVTVFNLETEEHKHLASHCGVSSMCACFDFRYCLTGAVGDKSLKIWNLSSSIVQPMRKVKKQQGLSEIWPMIDNPRYVLAKAVDNGPISVWNVTKGKCLRSAVRIERGLTEGYDALVVRNTRLVVLTDRGLSNVSSDPVHVFQTVLVYDLKMKKYIRKLQGCYIVPAASHEYCLLDDDSLMGPSDNRSHFIVWNLVTGHAVLRIKTAFRELEKRLEQSTQCLDGAVGKRDTVLMNSHREKQVASKSGRRNKDDKRTEVDTRRLELLRGEKDNVVEQFLVSGDQKVMVASFYAHHLCVFDIQSHSHTHTLQAEHSMMFLHTAALTFTGSHLVHANYDEISKNSYVTLWDCTTGEIIRRLKNEKDVIALAITDDAQRVVIGRASNEIHIWDPMKSNSLKRIRGYAGFHFGNSSKIFLVENGEKAIVFAADISVWDLTTRTMLAVFTPDSKISVCKVILNGRLILLGMYDKPELVVLKLTSGTMKQVEDTGGVELFGETTGDTSEEEEEEDEEHGS